MEISGNYLILLNVDFLMAIIFWLFNKLMAGFVRYVNFTKYEPDFLTAFLQVYTAVTPLKLIELQLNKMVTETLYN